MIFIAFLPSSITQVQYFVCIFKLVRNCVIFFNCTGIWDGIRPKDYSFD